ncbi:MAG: hypothetical protein IT158_05380 [Bryobacterales bacterium]|nr:hypothetical protein [Bryobacterales bacterium]
MERPGSPHSQILDPLGQRLELPEAATFFPLGCPVEIQSNSARVIDAVREGWGLFPRLFDRPPVRLRVTVSPELSTGAHGAPVFQAREHLFSIVLNAANFAVCDLRRGFAFACLAAETAADPDYLRWFFTDAMAYSILTTLYFTPVHAACVALAGRGVLLCGGPGAGKSTLAYACAKAGFTYLSDDVASLVRAGAARLLVGKPYHFRFRDTAAGLFPELRTFTSKTAQNGKPSIEVGTRELAGVRTAVTCEAEFLVFLNRWESGEASLNPVAPEEAKRRLRAGLPVLEPRAWSEQCASLEKLAARPAFELRYSSLDAAVICLERLLGDAG